MSKTFNIYCDESTHLIHDGDSGRKKSDDSAVIFFFPFIIFITMHSL